MQRKLFAVAPVVSLPTLAILNALNVLLADVANSAANANGSAQRVIYDRRPPHARRTTGYVDMVASAARKRPVPSVPAKPRLVADKSHPQEMAL